MSVFISQKVIDRIDSRDLLDALDKLNIVPDILAYRVADEIQVRHRLGSEHTLLSDSRRGCLGFQSTRFQDNSALPVRSFFYGDRSVAVPAPIDYAPDQYAIPVVESRVDVFEIS